RGFGVPQPRPPTLFPAVTATGQSFRKRVAHKPEAPAKEAVRATLRWRFRLVSANSKAWLSNKEPSRVRLDQPGSDGVAHQPGNVVDVEPLHQLHAVRLHRLDADLQPAGDLLGRLALGDHLQDLALPRRQLRRRLRSVRRQPYVAGHDVFPYLRAEVGF